MDEGAFEENEEGHDMKATLTFKLPEEEPEHRYALAGVDALLLISDFENEIRSKLRYDSGEFKEFTAERYGDDGVTSERVKGDDDTLEKVWRWIIDQKQARNLPELV
jgi:hypothetical protein